MACYGLMLPLMLYRLIFSHEVPDAAKPTIAILAAPASLSLAGYLTVSQDPSLLLVAVLLGIAVLMTGIIYLAFIKLLRLPFSLPDVFPAAGPGRHAGSARASLRCSRSHQRADPAWRGLLHKGLAQGVSGSHRQGDRSLQSIREKAQIVAHSGDIKVVFTGITCQDGRNCPLSPFDSTHALPRSRV